MGSALRSKWQKEYWAHDPRVAASPLVLAIEDFRSANSLGFANAGLLSYLYGAEIPDSLGEAMWAGTKVRHVLGAKSIPSGFFYQPGAEHVSAVIFSNAGTVAKFNRMGHQAAPNPGVRMRRDCIIQNNGGLEPLHLAYEVGTGFRERWDQEMVVFHNPNALHPLPRGFMPDAGHQWAEYDGELRSSFPHDFHIYVQDPCACGLAGFHRLRPMNCEHLVTASARGYERPCYGKKA